METILDELLRLPLDAELARWTHVAEERGRRDDRGRREVAQAADAHPVRPVPIKGGDRGLALDQRVGALAEARSAPRLTDLPADGAEDIGDRLAAQARIRPLDLFLDAARAREDHELLRGLRGALRLRSADHQSGLEQVAVAAVRARADEGLVEGEVFARDLRRGERVGRREWLGDQRLDLRQVQVLVDLPRNVVAR